MHAHAQLVLTHAQTQQTAQTLSMLTVQDDEDIIQ